MSQGPVSIAPRSISGLRTRPPAPTSTRSGTDADIAFLIGGGNEGVQAIVNDAEEAGYPNVFAVIDRDFRESNKASWINPGKTSRRFILPAHEIENYLLDADALAASRFNTMGKTAVEINKMMATAASRLCWWAACRDVVAELRRRFRQDFMQDPRCPPVDSEAQARNHICDAPWFVRLARKSAARPRPMSTSFCRSLISQQINRYPMVVGGAISPAKRSFAMSVAGSATTRRSPEPSRVRPGSMKISPRKSVPGRDRIRPSLPISPIFSRPSSSGSCGSRPRP